MLGEPEASIHTGLLWQGSWTQGDFFTCRWRPAMGKPTPHEVSFFVFRNGSSFTLHHPDQRPERASLFSAAGCGLVPVQVHCPVREGKPSAKLENHVLCLFSFFSIFKQKGDVGLLTISSYSFPRKETPSTLVRSAHGHTCDHEGSDSTSVHPSQGRHGAHPWGWFAQPSAVVLGNVC